jgi:hypothetical protein
MVKHECDKCKRAKSRIVAILEKNPNYQNVSTDDDYRTPKFPAERISEFLPEKDYWPDIYCEKASKTLMFDDIQLLRLEFFPVIIEVDHATHKSKIQTVKDNRRDKHFLAKRIPTIRFPLDRVIGKRHWDDNMILYCIEKEIEYQLA